MPARGGAEVALKIYITPFSSIELACAVRQPSPCVRALCETDVVFHMSHLKLHFTLHSWQSAHSTLHTSHCTLCTSHSTLFTLHTLHTSHCTLRSQHFTLHTPHFTLHTSHSTLHTALFTPHTSHCTLHTPHFISSELFSALLHVSKVEGNSCWCIANDYRSLDAATPIRFTIFSCKRQ